MKRSHLLTFFTEQIGKLRAEKEASLLNRAVRSGMEMALSTYKGTSLSKGTLETRSKPSPTVYVLDTFLRTQSDLLKKIHRKTSLDIIQVGVWDFTVANSDISNCLLLSLFCEGDAALSKVHTSTDIVRKDVNNRFRIQDKFCWKLKLDLFLIPPMRMKCRQVKVHLIIKTLTLELVWVMRS